MVAEPFLGQIFMFAGNFAPKGYALCNGQLLSIAENQTLFAILGTTYGGDGIRSFGLPNLQGRIPVHADAGNGFTLGRTSGETSHTLTTNEMPQHTHTPSGGSAVGTQRSPQSNVWAASTSPFFSDSAPNTTMAPQALAQTGGNQPHDNMPPYRVVNFIIALQGIYPSTG
jgi:microcystin-dependent protein